MADGAVLELQAAVKAHLLADSSVTGLLGTRLYQAVPTPPTFPYAVFGRTTNSSDSTSCQRAWDVLLDIDVWSREPGWEEIKRVVSAITISLDDDDLTLATQRCVQIIYVTDRNIEDAELPVKHNVVTFRANLEEI